MVLHLSLIFAHQSDINATYERMLRHLAEANPAYAKLSPGFLKVDEDFSTRGIRQWYTSSNGYFKTSGTLSTIVKYRNVNEVTPVMGKRPPSEAELKNLASNYLSGFGLVGDWRWTNVHLDPQYDGDPDYAKSSLQGQLFYRDRPVFGTQISMELGTYFGLIDDLDADYTTKSMDPPTFLPEPKTWADSDDAVFLSVRAAAELYGASAFRVEPPQQGWVVPRFIKTFTTSDIPVEDQDKAVETAFPVWNVTVASSKPDPKNADKWIWFTSSHQLAGDTLRNILTNVWGEVNPAGYGGGGGCCQNIDMAKAGGPYFVRENGKWRLVEDAGVVPDAGPVMPKFLTRWLKMGKFMLHVRYDPTTRRIWLPGVGNPQVVRVNNVLARALSSGTKK